MPTGKKETSIATRRGFLFSLLGGLAGAAGLSSIVAGTKASPEERATGAAVPEQPVAKPIDNIFTPLSPKNLKRRGQ
ncbi:MAG: hypothetical protein ACHQ49_12490 [Elusimicrobiota bacterium]